MNNKQFLKEKIPQKTLNSNKNMSLAKAIFFGLGLATLSEAIYADDWTYFGAYNTSNGKPAVMVDKSSKIPADMLSRVLTLLPEGQRIDRTPESQALLTSDLGGNIFLKKDAHVTVAFVHEGAGYTNGIGFFQFTNADLTNSSVTADDKIIFPNFSKKDSGGELKFGDAIDLGDFTAGTALGFTVVANGWKSSLQKVDPNKSANCIFRTVKALNPEQELKNAHTVLLSSPQDQILVLGIEDLNRENKDCDFGYKTDDDFNDAVLAIFVEPFDAVDTSNIVDLNTGKVTGSGGSGSGHGVSGRLNWREITTPK
ncbi:MAG: DUF4114 domain-containing protein [Methylococcaceae bacterium]